MNVSSHSMILHAVSPHNIVSPLRKSSHSMTEHSSSPTHTATSKPTTQVSVSGSTITTQHPAVHTIYSTTTYSIETTHSRTTTSAASSATAAPWLIRIYSDEHCKWPHYVVHDCNEHITNEYLYLYGHLATSSSGDKLTCRLFPEDRDGEWKSCDESSLKSPQSWKVESGNCTVSDNDTCKSDSYGQVHSSWDKKSCQNMKDSKFNTMTLKFSLKS